MRLLTLSGLPIVGTLETIKAIAEIADFNDNGEPNWLGETMIDWDSQQTDERDGSFVYVDDNANQYLRPELVKGKDEGEEVSIWRLANEESYGEQAGWYMLTTPDGEDEIDGGPWATEEEAKQFAANASYGVVDLNLESPVDKNVTMENLSPGLKVQLPGSSA